MNPPHGIFGKKMPLDYYTGTIYKIDEKEIIRWRKLTYKKYDGLESSSSIVNFVTNSKKG